jgi:hypothetical protein
MRGVARDRGYVFLVRVERLRVAAFRGHPEIALEARAQLVGLAAQPLGALVVTGLLVLARGGLPVGHLRADELLHLRLGEAAPLDLGGADAQHRAGDVRAPDARRRRRRAPGRRGRARRLRRRGADGLGVVDRRQGRPQRRHGHRVPRLDGLGQRGPQALP